MKRRLAPLLTFTIALILVSGLAYAAKNKDKSKSGERPPEPTHEEEALQAELLEAIKEPQATVTHQGDAGLIRNVPVDTKEKIKDQMIDRQRGR